MSKKVVATSINIGSIYIINLKQRWYRVRVDADITKNIAISYKCFFIDIGCFMVVTKSCLFWCPKQFTELPPKALCFTLIDLIDFSKHPYAQPCLKSLLNNKRFVIKIFTTDNKPVNFLERNANLLCAKVYAIYCDQLIEYNSIIINEIIKATPKLKLHQPVSAIRGRASYVSDSELGIVYFQIDQVGLKYINMLIKQFKRDNLNSVDRFGLKLLRSLHTILVYDDTDKKYYRAKIFAQDEEEKEFFQCFYVDYGFIKTCSKSVIFDISSTNVALYNYPSQAIPVALNKLENFDRQTLKRLRHILKNSNRVILKYVSDVSHGPIVDIFKRYEPSGDLYCLNNLLEMEIGLRE